MTGLTIKARMYINLSVVCAVLLVVCLTGITYFNRLSHRMEVMYSDALVPIANISEIYQRSLQSQQYRLEAYVHRDQKFTQSNYESIKRNRARINELMESIDKLDLSAQERAIADAIKADRASLVSVGKEEMEALLAGNYDAAAKARLAGIEPVIDHMDATSEQLATQRLAAAEAMVAAARDEVATGHRVMLGSFVIALAVAGFIAWLLIRHISRGLSRAEDLAVRVSRGELGNKMTIGSMDEIGLVLQALQDMDTKLSSTVLKVRDSANAVDHAARQLSQGSDDLSERTQEQAAALEETAASIEQMTATVKQTEDNAKQANQLATGTRVQADEGGTVVRQAVGAMQEITTSSKRIEDIIGVIDDIAFQTNLLALNAAVESARAGEQGRGFAVVASEVRHLAQRSASAAREIKTLIGDSVGKVGAGAALVDESGATLADIVTGVKKVSDIVAEIAAATTEQSAGIDQINQAIANMDGATQQNAALVEESAAAAKLMQQQAYELQTLVSFFSIQGATNAAVPTALPAAQPLTRRKNVIPYRAKGTRSAQPLQRPANGNAAQEWHEF
jgi:methyl-accepting chemotaxis protein